MISVEVIPDVMHGADLDVDPSSNLGSEDGPGSGSLQAVAGRLRQLSAEWAVGVASAPRLSLSFFSSTSSGCLGILGFGLARGDAREAVGERCVVRSSEWLRRLNADELVQGLSVCMGAGHSSGGTGMRLA